MLKCVSIAICRFLDEFVANGHTDIGASQTLDTPMYAMTPHSVAQTGLPAYVLPEGPYPGSTEPTNGTGQTLHKAVSCRELEERFRVSRIGGER